MNYKLWDTYMVRTPALPCKYLEEYTESGLDIYEFISKNDFLDSFFKKSLLIASDSLYKSYINVPDDKKKYRNLCSGLLKYFIRATSRPVPFGYFASVSLGNFGQETLIKKENTIIDISPDTNWANGLIRKIEDKNNCLNKLSLKFNNICYVSGDRLKNPYFSNRGNLSTETEKIKDNSIRNTPLIELVKSNSHEFIKYNDLFEIIQKEYDGIDEQLIHKTISDLVKNEYLLTNLRLPTYCDDILEHIVNVINNINDLKDINAKLLCLRGLISDYKKSDNEDKIIEIIELMKCVHESSNYLELNTGFYSEDNMLDAMIIEKMNKFIDTILCISPEASMYNFVKKIIDKFSEEYGNNVEVELTQIIDSNGFNALELLGGSYETSKREKTIQEIINSKIMSAVINNESVKLSKKDFCDIDNENIEFALGFDINFFITKNEENYNLIIGPNVGSSNQGAMFQRFKNAFNSEKFGQYNELYNKVTENVDDAILVELRECTVNGRTSNVVNNTKNYKYYFAIAMVENEDYYICLKDIVVGLDYNNKMYFKSKSLGKKLIFVKDNMLNTKINSKLYQLLYEVSSSNFAMPLNRIFLLDKDRFFTPRIYLENVVIKLKQWKFNESILSKKNIETFKIELRKLLKEYKVDNKVYLVENDNRLIIDLNNQDYMNIVYDTFKKKGEVVFSELEPNLLDESLAKDDEDRFVNEFVFSYYLDKATDRKINDTNYNINTGKLSLGLENKNRVFLPFEDGWIYFKLYGLGNRTDEFLKKELEVIKEFEFEKWFFIRYADSNGEHIRLRLKFKNEDTALKYYANVLNWFKSITSKKIFDYMQLDTYKREVNRYGGSNFIELFEQYSQISSQLVIETLKNFNIEEKKEEIYFFETLMIYLSFNSDIEEILHLIDNYEIRKSHRDEFKYKRESLIEAAEKYINGDLGEFECLKDSITSLQQIIKTYSEKIQQAENNDMLTNTKASVIGAIAHMHCNRLTGDRNLEYFTLTMMRHTLFAICEKRKHFK